MSVFIDRKYLGQLSFRLELFKQKKQDLYNFRCPFCGDSQKQKQKSRGYLYRKGNDYFYRCHNCSMGTTFSNFLKALDPQAHKQYVLECYMNGNHKNAPVEQPNFDELRGNAASAFKKKIVGIPRIADLPEDHYARVYISSRKIPLSAWNSIYYAEHFKEFMDKEFPDHGKEEIPDDDRIVLLYRNRDGDVTNVAGRALGNTKIRYITVKVLDEQKVFGLDRVDTSQPVYITEGQFDSLFLDNAIAAGDSNLVGLALVVHDILGVKPTLIFDNEPRNKDIVKQIGRAVDAGHELVIWPSDIEQKDINDMVIAGVDAKSVIANNIYKGLSAKLKFMSWKRC